MANRVDFGMWVGSSSWPNLSEFSAWQFYIAPDRVGRSLGYKPRGGFEGFEPGELVIKNVANANTVCGTPLGFINTNLNPRTGTGGNKTPIPYREIADGNWDTELRLNARECAKVNGKIYLEVHSEANVQTPPPDAQPLNPGSPEDPNVTRAQGIQNWLDMYTHIVNIFYEEYAILGKAMNIKWVISLAGTTSNVWGTASTSDASAYIKSVKDYEAAQVVFPGRVYLDIVGIDAYSHSGQDKSPAELFDAGRIYATNTALKPWGCFETGHHQGQTVAEADRKAQWHLDLADYFETWKANAAAFMYTASEGFYWPEYYIEPTTDPRNGYSSPCWLTFVTMANRPVFTQVTGGGTTDPKVAVIVMGAADYTIVTSASAPTMRATADGYEELTNMYGVDSFDLANYCAMTCGSALGRTGGNVIAGVMPLAVNNIFAQLEAASKTWRIYAEDYNPGAAVGVNYVGFRDPAKYYTGLQAHAWHVDFDGSDGLMADIAGGTLPDFSFILPNKLNQGRTLGVAGGDAWIGGSNPNANTPPFSGIAALRSALGPTGILIILYDRSHNDVTNGGGHVYASVSGPSRVGYGPTTSGATLVDHYDLLASIQAVFGLPKFTVTGLEPTYTLAAGYSGATTSIDLSSVSNPAVLMGDAQGESNATGVLTVVQHQSAALGGSAEGESEATGTLTVTTTAPAAVATKVRQARRFPAP